MKGLIRLSLIESQELQETALMKICEAITTTQYTKNNILYENGSPSFSNAVLKNLEEDPKADLMTYKFSLKLGIVHALRLFS